MNALLFVILAQPAAGCGSAEPGALCDFIDTVAGLEIYGEPTLPECASPLMREIFDATKEDAKKRGTTPAGLFATGRNAAAAKPLLEGPEIFGEMATLIEGAEKEVTLEMFVWETESEPSRTLLAALKTMEERRRAAGATEPVEVRFLVDVMNNPIKPFPGVIPELQEKIAELGLDPALIRVQVDGFPHVALGNLHSKALTVDGKHAVVTGANVEVVHGGEDRWFDSGYRVDGDIAYALRQEFGDALKKSRGWTCGRRMREGCSPPARRLTYLEPPVGDPNVCVPMMLVGRKDDANPFGNRDDNTQDQAYLAAFRGAEEVIRVQTPNLNDDKAKRALLDAMKRGVRVELILSKKFNEKAVSLPGQGGGNEKNARELYQKLREAGVADPCSVLQVRWFSRDGVNAIEGNGAGASHAKYASIDGQIAIVGSANQDTQAWNHSRETNVLVDDAATTASWDEKLFEANWDRGVAEPCR